MLLPFLSLVHQHLSTDQSPVHTPEPQLAQSKRHHCSQVNTRLQRCQPSFPSNVLCMGREGDQLSHFSTGLSLGLRELLPFPSPCPVPNDCHMFEAFMSYHLNTEVKTLFFLSCS